MTFEWEDITDELLEKIVCIFNNRTMGMGEPGDFEAVAENGQIYFATLYSFSKANGLLDRFLGEHPVTSREEQERTHQIGKWRWIDSVHTRIYIRKDYYDRIYPEIKKLGDQAWISGITAVKKLLDPQGKLPTLVFSETQAIRDEEERQRREKEKWKAKNRLVEGEDYEWKEFDGGGLRRGYYLLLFKENEDGTISGSRWTIVCQLEQFEEGGFKSDAPVEAYNLYYKRYENMGGILDYPEDGKREDKEIYRYTTLEDDPKKDCNYGEFHRTYFTLEQAKSAALTRNEFLGWGNYYKANLLKRNWSETSLEEAKKDYFRAVKRERELQLLFPKICGEVLQILSKYDFPGNAITEIGESLGLSRNDVRIILRFFSHASMFSEVELEEAEKILAEAKEIYDV